MFGFSALSISPFSTDVEVSFDVVGVSAIAASLLFGWMTPSSDKLSK